MAASSRKMTRHGSVDARRPSSHIGTLGDRVQRPLRRGLGYKRVGTQTADWRRPSSSTLYAEHSQDLGLLLRSQNWIWRAGPAKDKPLHRPPVLAGDGVMSDTRNGGIEPTNVHRL